MKKNVCMFVWNHFTNDARVMRECTTLSEAGYHVDLIAIHDPNEQNLPLFEEFNESFHVHRVKRYPPLLQFLQRTIRFFARRKLLALLPLLIIGFALYTFPLMTSLFILMALMTLQPKSRTVWIRSSIFMRMVFKGRSRPYDIYHSNDLNTLPQGVLCSKFRFKKKNLIYDSHEVQTSRTGYDSGIYAKMEGLLLPFVNTMIVENHTRAKYNEEFYGFYPEVLHNYPFQVEEEVESAPLHKELGLPKSEKILLYQGGIQTGRGLDKLVQAMPFIKEGTLVFIGDGRIKTDLQTQVKKMGLEDRIKFIPKVPLAELPSYTKNAYIGFQVLNNVCFNHYSASSNKLFEYIMAEVPVVACDFPEIKKVVEGEGTGVCVDSHNHEDIAEKVNYLLSNPELVKEMSARCIKAKAIYNWDSEKNTLLTIYKNSQLISSKNTASMEMD
ncbi:glycosyl transferase [Salipaludibacillus keqinensis]|uniref:Glycosyl transferase n=1 Tax=Salipaludibacillus keqinensis TaxID=2045207 RepID=A0A323TIU5_9BACI|nr:glycosyltransferase [Salipaludibacillus keqinensis]PYZ92593.1 glycosyl transferase [Salipaludibacillus keqinensis]